MSAPRRIELDKPSVLGVQDLLVEGVFGQHNHVALIERGLGLLLTSLLWDLPDALERELSDSVESEVNQLLGLPLSSVIQRLAIAVGVDFRCGSISVVKSRD